MDPQHHFSYTRDQMAHQVGRLKTLLRDTSLDPGEREVAQAMLEFYEDARTLEERCLSESPEGFVPTKPAELPLSGASHVARSKVCK